MIALALILAVFLAAGINVLAWLQNPIVGNLILVGAGAVGGWIARHLKGPADVDRASTLALVAEGAVAIVVARSPGQPYAVLVQQVITEIASRAGLPTKNQDAINGAAQAALQKAGIKPA